MYKQFTEDDQLNFVAQYGIVDYVFFMDGLSDRAKSVYQILLSELKRLKYKGKLKVDDKGIYVELARSVIGGFMDKCSHTIAKYIKELQAHGLLADRRMGVNLCNRIYLKYPQNATRYSKDKETKKSRIIKMFRSIKNNGVKSANPTPSDKYDIQLIDKANAIITQLTNKNLPKREVEQLLTLCKCNLDELNKAVEYCMGKPYNNATAKIADTIRKGYHKEEPKPKDEPVQKFKSKGKQQRFTNIAEHGFNFEDIQKAERLKVSLDLGNITKEHYESEIKKLKIQ